MLAALRNTSRALEHYRCPITGRQRSLRYFIDRRGRHTVCVDYPALEQTFPDVQKFWKVEDARQCWRELRQEFACRGLERVR